MDHVTRHSKAPHSKMCTCLSSGLKLDQTNLLKFVISPDNSLILDLKDELPGKSFWITSSRKILEASCKENLFSQASLKKIHIPENFLLQVETSLVKQFNATIGFCRRSGLLVWGFEKVRATLLKEKALLRIEALDGSDGEKLKLDSITIVPVLQSLYAHEMAATLGRKRLVHCALLKRDKKSVMGLASSLKEKSFRLAKFRMTV